MEQTSEAGILAREDLHFHIKVDLDLSVGSPLFVEFVHAFLFYFLAIFMVRLMLLLTLGWFAFLEWI